MSTRVAGGIEPAHAPRGGAVDKIAILAGKLVVTGACFWYISRQIDLRQAAGAVPRLEWRYFALAVAIALAQIPLLGLRWRNILDGIGAAKPSGPLTRPSGDARAAASTSTADVMAITAIGMFFAQVLPGVASEGVRAWLLVRSGASWSSLASVVIDRAVGVGLLVAFAFAALLMPSAKAALGHYRDPALVACGALLAAAPLVLLLVPKIAPPLARWHYARWVAALAAAAHRALLGRKGAAIVLLGCLVHALTIVSVWAVAQAQGLILPAAATVVLFTVMIGVGLIPVSISGWGVRELAVIALLGHYGVAPENALLLSVCFGLVLVLGSLPGAFIWIAYSLSPRASGERA